MNRLLIIFSCMLSILAAASSAEAAHRHRFWGAMVVTSATAICAGEVDQKFAVRFRPSGLGDGTSSTITLFRHDSARHFEVNGLFSSAFQAVTATDVFDYVSTPSNVVSVRFLSQSPTNITTTTTNIVMRGQIRGWDENPTCTLTFGLVLTKRPDPS